MKKISGITLLGAIFFVVACKPHNAFSFCRDFDPNGCIEPLEKTATYSLEKTTRDKTLLTFANSIYFRGDRLAFALKNARSKYDVTFECLHGRYFFSDDNAAKQEIEYLELRENNIYGLVMTGSLIEKKYAVLKAEPYRPVAPFQVTYAVYCGKDLLAQQAITVELK